MCIIYTCTIQVGLQAERNLSRLKINSPTCSVLRPLVINMADFYDIFGPIIHDSSLDYGNYELLFVSTLGLFRAIMMRYYNRPSEIEPHLARCDGFKWNILIFLKAVRLYLRKTPFPPHCAYVFPSRQSPFQKFKWATTVFTYLTAYIYNLNLANPVFFVSTQLFCPYTFL